MHGQTLMWATILHDSRHDTVLAVYDQQTDSSDGAWIDCSRFETVSVILTVAGEGTVLTFAANDPLEPQDAGVQVGVPLSFDVPTARYFGPDPVGRTLPRWLRFSFVNVEGAQITILLHGRKR